MSTWKYAGNLLNIKTIKLNSSNNYSANISDFIDNNSTVFPFFQVNRLVGDSNPLTKIDLSYRIDNGIFKLIGGIGRAELFKPEDISADVLNKQDWLDYVPNTEPNATTQFIRVDNSTIKLVANFKSPLENMAIRWKGFFSDAQYTSGYDTRPISHNRLQITIQVGSRMVYSNVTSGYDHTIFGLFFKYRNESNLVLTIKDLDGNRVYVDGFEGMFNYMFVQYYSVKKNMSETTMTNYAENDLEVEVFLIKRSVV